jgi:hypothetical protein
MLTGKWAIGIIAGRHKYFLPLVTTYTEFSSNQNIPVFDFAYIKRRCEFGMDLTDIVNISRPSLPVKILPGRVYFPFTKTGNKNVITESV